MPGAEDPVGEVCSRLRAAGMRMTDQRRRLVELFASLGHWCTPQELYAEAEEAGQRPGLATVYRLIEALAEIGLCKSFVQGDRTVRYVFCPPFHHHHLICLDCGRVANVTDCHVDAPRADFKVSAHAVDFFGTCSACSHPDGQDASSGRPADASR